MVVKELFANLAILSSMIFFYVQSTKDSPLNTKSSLSRKLFVGASGGILSNILMQYGIQVHTTIIDLRHIPVILMALFGGAIPALVALVLVIVGRLLIGVNSAACAAIASITLITLAAIYFSKRNVKNKTKIWSVLTLSNLFFS
ncbi:MAG: LytS/YhcK type 5TM receptor domain-containing protein, partial [Bacillota bacterium]|nr:LytS/YhcK type 5TM receptor domain-containing protein [Bacillota bacterium]